MEKVKIQSAIDSGRQTKDNRKVYNVSIEGRDNINIASCDDFTQFIGKEVEVELKKTGTYKDVDNYWISLPKAAGQGGKPKTDWTYMKRKDALTLAVNRCHVKPDASTEDIEKVADRFLKWLKAE